MSIVVFLCYVVISLVVVMALFYSTKMLLKYIGIKKVIREGTFIEHTVSIWLFYFLLSISMIIIIYYIIKPQERNLKQFYDSGMLLLIAQIISGSICVFLHIVIINIINYIISKKSSKVRFPHVSDYEKEFIYLVECIGFAVYCLRFEEGSKISLTLIVITISHFVWFSMCDFSFFYKTFGRNKFIKKKIRKEKKINVEFSKELAYSSLLIILIAVIFAIFENEFLELSGCLIGGGIGLIIIYYKSYLEDNVV